MKKLLFAFLFAFALISCNKNSGIKSISDLEKESLKTGIKHDTILGDLKFGYTERELYKSLNINKNSGYVLPIFDDGNFEFSIDPYYYNDSLYSIRFTLFQLGYKYESIVNAYTIKYNKPDTTFAGTQFDSDCNTTYWFKGNLEIEINMYTLSKSQNVSITYKDLSRNTDNFDGKLIQDKERYFDYWTKDYYKNVYLPRKKKDLNGI